MYILYLISFFFFLFLFSSRIHYFSLLFFFLYIFLLFKLLLFFLPSHFQKRFRSALSSFYCRHYFFIYFFKLHLFLFISSAFLSFASLTLVIFSPSVSHLIFAKTSVPWRNIRGEGFCDICKCLRALFVNQSRKYFPTHAFFSCQPIFDYNMNLVNGCCYFLPVYLLYFLICDRQWRVRFFFSSGLNRRYACLVTVEGVRAWTSKSNYHHRLFISDRNS
ncbi:unnamed protein product [Acanthosepion pharaonis]|uniref:Uncharacterized protein n=1 Tax=Acanthosepion pharaonis TaxID=158019 RepID=A0A812DP10_ACAPH|nr:unnamed protein product [Sepia pharaonis]